MTLELNEDDIILTLGSIVVYLKELKSDPLARLLKRDTIDKLEKLVDKLCDYMK